MEKSKLGVQSRSSIRGKKGRKRKKRKVRMMEGKMFTMSANGKQGFVSVFCPLFYANSFIMTRIKNKGEEARAIMMK